MRRSVGIGDERTQSVAVEVGERKAVVDLAAVVDYGESIPRIAGAMRENISRRIEGMTGLTVTDLPKAPRKSGTRGRFAPYLGSSGLPSKRASR